MFAAFFKSVALCANARVGREIVTSEIVNVMTVTRCAMVAVERLSSRGRKQLRDTQVVDEKLADPARVQRFVGHPLH